MPTICRVICWQFDNIPPDKNTYENVNEMGKFFEDFSLDNFINSAWLQVFSNMDEMNASKHSRK